MKTISDLLKGKFILCIFLCMSCINDIPEDAKMKGNVPLTFTAQIKSATSTRVSNNKFDEEDSVGLFVCIQPEDLKTERYADNLRFTYSIVAEEFVTEKSIFYPEGKVLVDMFSYYPYRPQGVENGSSLMSVEINKDQSTRENYSTSDFLVAETKGVNSSEKVNMAYEHKFSRVKLSMVVASGIDEAVLQDKKPFISISGFNTCAVYDFDKKTFASLSDRSSIEPYGTWTWDETQKKLVGKEVILIPQNILPDEQMITIELDGKIYYSKLPDDAELVSGKQCEISITFQPAIDKLLSSVQGTITDWIGDVTHNVESGTNTNYIDVTRLSFTSSSIYKVIYQGKTIAKICKEYLLADNVSSPAIVVYPADAKGEANLAQGVVMQLLGNPQEVHGGKVVWDKITNTLQYTAGTKPLQERFYITSDKSISLTSPENALTVVVQSDIIRDKRRETVREYPVVKIATQYWMRENLHATLYTDGTAMTKLSKMTAGDKGYLLSASSEHFYSPNAVLTGKLAPEGWKIPVTNDWEILKAYIKDNASLLKSGTWAPIKTGGEVFPFTNATGLSIIPAGMYMGTYQSTYENKYAAFWTLDDSGTGLAESVFVLKSDINEATKAGVTEDKAFSIRCLYK